MLLDYRLYFRNDRMNFVSRKNRRLKFLFNYSQFNHVNRNRNHFSELERNSLKDHDRYNVSRYENRDYDRPYTRNDDRIIERIDQSRERSLKS